jgi:hypothetical protein
MHFGTHKSYGNPWEPLWETLMGNPYGKPLWETLMGTHKSWANLGTY